MFPCGAKKKKLLQLVIKNAQIALEVNSSSGRVRSYETLKALQETINMSTLPYRVEAFDISNIQGTNSVASMVVWEAGRPKKSDYRKFKIRGVVGPDDFRSMAEVIERRVKRALDKEWPIPDLMIIDGGKGQLNAALEVLERHGMNDQPIMGLAKREEEIFLPGRSESIKLEERSQVLKFIQQVRNEAHRFAITFHRQLRSKRSMEMALDEIPGIGPKRKQLLMQHFGSLENVRSATKDELKQKLGKVQGDRLYVKLHPEATAE